MSSLSKSHHSLTDKYQKQDVLGQGNSGTTYLATSLEDDTEVALKELSLRACQNWKMLDLFEREVAILKTLDHPAIPRYVDSFICESEGDRHYYLAQTIAEGKSLADWIEGGWRATESDVIDIAQQLLSILVYLQSIEPSVIHRDIKPNNIIRSEKGKISLVDFGAVGHVYQNTFMRGSTVVGTFGYMAPEQFRGKAFPATDLYSVGTTLLFLLTRRSPAELPTKQLSIDFRSKVNISDNFASWLEKLLAPDLEDRFSTAQQALTSLNRRALYRWKPRFQKSSSPWLAGSVLTVCMLSGWVTIRYPYALLSMFNSTRIERGLRSGGISIADYSKKGGSRSIHSGLAPSLFVASLIHQEDYALAKEMLDEGFDLKARGSEGETAIHIIVQGKHLEALSFLRQQRPDLDLNMVNSRGMTPVQSASDEEIALELIALGVDLNTEDNDGISFFQQAIINGWNVVCNQYIRQYDPESENAIKHSNEGLIGIAMNAGRYEIAQQLIDSGLRLTAIDFSYVQLSKIRESFLAENFLAITDLTALDADGYTLIHAAVLREDINLLKKAIEKGVSAHLHTRTGETPIQLTAFERQHDYSYKMSDILVVLLKADTQTSAAALNKAGVLHRLIYIPDIDVEEEIALVKGLIERGVSVNYQDTEGNAPLHYTDRVEISKLLIESGADVNAPNKKGFTPLHYARSLSMGKLLIENGADIKKQTPEGELPLTHFPERQQVVLMELYDQTRNWLNRELIEH